MDEQKRHREWVSPGETVFGAGNGPTPPSPGKSAANAGNAASGERPAKRWKRGDWVCFAHDLETVRKVIGVQMVHGEQMVQFAGLSGQFGSHIFVEAPATAHLPRCMDRGDGVWDCVVGCPVAAFRAAPIDLPPVMVEARWDAAICRKCRKARSAHKFLGFHTSGDALWECPGGAGEIPPARDADFDSPAPDPAVGESGAKKPYSTPELTGPFSLREVEQLKAEVARLTALINTPEILDFTEAVRIEAVHQRERWGSKQDEGKTAADWFWLLGYLAGKAISADKSGDRKKLLHHIITSAAACANWHAQVLGTCDMRPGIETPAGEK